MWCVCTARGFINRLLTFWNDSQTQTNIIYLQIFINYGYQCIEKLLRINEHNGGEWSYIIQYIIKRILTLYCVLCTAHGFWKQLLCSWNCSQTQANTILQIFMNYKDDRSSNTSKPGFYEIIHAVRYQCILNRHYFKQIRNQVSLMTIE